MFRPLPFVTVREQHDEAVGAQPFRLARRDKLVDHDLRAVGEIAELRFPHHQRLGVGEGVAIFEAKHAIFGERRVEHLEAAVLGGRERHVFVFVGLIHPDGVALREGAAPRILPGQAHAIALRQ